MAIDAWARLLRTHAAMRRTLSTQLQADHGLTVNEYEALLLLSRAEGRRMRRVDLSDELQLTPSGVTRLLDRLGAQGFVTKANCAVDARVTYAVLTDAGAAKLEQAACSHVASVQAVFEERFTPEQIATLADLLARLPGGGTGAEECKPGDH